jgi:hypothetical protein
MCKRLPEGTERREETQNLRGISKDKNIDLPCTEGFIDWRGVVGLGGTS